MNSRDATCKVLVADDDDRVAQVLHRVLPGRGFAVTSATCISSALESLRRDDFDLLVTDLAIRDDDGTPLSRRALALRSDLGVVVTSRTATMQSAVAALRAGAHDFVTKPFEVEALVGTLERVRDARAVDRALDRVAASPPLSPDDDGLFGESPPLRDLRELVQRLATTDVSVVVTGESGTGKELVARAIHRQSPRASRPFVSVNCAALPEALLESELFGHKRGAFTDAHHDRSGLFVQARGGTLFLDEIADLPLGVQPKLLRALQERRVRPVGSDEEVEVDVRIIAATHRVLADQVREGRFREDLYYRLDVAHIEVPTLRARRADVLPLAQHFLDRFAAAHGRPVRRIGAAAAEKLLTYAWPGNVRELANSIERAVALARFDEIGLEDLPERVRTTREVRPQPPPPRRVADVLPLDEIQRRYTFHVLDLVEGNKTIAARLLGIDRATLYRWLDREARVQNDAQPSQIATNNRKMRQAST